jgi:hypothetical protein
LPDALRVESFPPDKCAFMAFCSGELRAPVFPVLLDKTPLVLKTYATYFTDRQAGQWNLIVDLVQKNCLLEGESPPPPTFGGC